MTPIRRMLIANRGEIAVRIIRTCRALGIETVLVVSDVDREQVPARLADRVLCIGPGRPSESYLKVETIVAAALGAKADAIHPGYGFLSENPKLARLCEREGIIFVGPTADQIEAVGDKLAARRHAAAAKVPVLPGGPAASLAEAEQLAASIGYPLLVKAVGGGGGRGMKRVDDAAALGPALSLAIAEAESAFGDPRIYLERFVGRGRHVEVQLLGDGERIVHLGDRDCSVQRRYQKVIEEAPAALPAALRTAMHAAAVRFGQALGYRGLGTVEFLVDGERGEFYFLEMNARIQVEHPVTEAVTGLDLVAEQIAVAEGRPLRLRQEDIHFSGHAIECRVNAEDPGNAFQPSPGTIREAVFPNGADVRVDSHVTAGAAVPPFYDSLLAKLIASGPDRAAALARLIDAVRRTRIKGVATNLAFLAGILGDREFAAGGVDTGFLARHLQARAAAEAAHGR
jgi:acetyl-CoA carboxylase biotin carboxylase subunit